MALTDEAFREGQIGALKATQKERSEESALLSMAQAQK